MIKFRQLFDLGGFRVTNVGTPTATTDATTKTYCDGKVLKAGDSMSGVLNMANNRVTAVGTPTGTTDAATKAYVDASYKTPSITFVSSNTNYTALAASDYVIYANNTNGISISLPDIGVSAGRLFLIRNLGTVTITIAAVHNTTLIDNAASQPLRPGEGRLYVYDGSVGYWSATYQLDFAGQRLSSLGTPTATTDAATKAYADLKVAKAGDSMTGALDMGTNKVTGLGTPTTGADAATKSYVDGLVGPVASTTLPLTTVTANYTATASDGVILANGAGITVTLPSAVTAGAGRTYTVKNINASAATIASTAGVIDTQTTVTARQFQAVTVVSDGANWFII